MIQFHYLEKGQMLRIEKAADVLVISGEAWVTRENDIKDHVLQAQGRLRNNPSGLMLIEALQNSTLLYSAQALEEWDRDPQTMGMTASRSTAPEAEARLSKAWSLTPAPVAGDQEQF